jgi:amino acid adenylation domain-containing protein
VKVRGYRIELGEIEAVLEAHAGISAAVVVVREDRAEEKQLVAYVVGAEGAEPPASSELRGYLQQQLPGYMVPGSFVVLAELPLTANGKIDRRALPAPDKIRSNEEYVGPRTAEEELVAGIWSSVLNVPKIGMHDNFFELGGHSLLATQVISRMREAFQVELPLRIIFESPTVAGLAHEVARIQAGAEGLIWQRLARVSREGKLPLSFSQQRLWFLEHWMGEGTGKASYNLATAPRFLGQLNIEALQQALSEVIRRHEALRTTFPTVEGEATQLITPAQPLTLEILDLSSLDQDNREAELQRIVNDEAQRPFELSTGPLWRCQMIRMAAEDHVLVLVMHHIVTDGWSLGVLLRELTLLYEAYAHGLDSPLAELPIQYVDYAAWQRERLQGEVLDQQISYWRKQLSGAPGVIPLPTDKPRPRVQSYRGARHTFVLPLELSADLKTLANSSGATLFMVLVAAFQSLLARYTAQPDIVVGTPIANRNRAETESLIGFFVNTLVLRTEVRGEMSFRDLIKRVREICLEAYAHQDVPLEKLVDELQPERELSHNPLFQVMLALQNAPAQDIELEGLTLSAARIENHTAKFDLTLNMIDTTQGLIGTLEYNTDLFEAATIKRLAGHFETLLRSIVTQPDNRIANLPLLQADERSQLLEWNQAQSELATDKCLHEWFEIQVEQTPNHVALVCGEQSLSYAELNGQANQLAHYLQTLGVGPEVLVGLFIERSIEMVVAILGVLKAGGAYVPLDPMYPSERLAFMLDDADIQLVLSQQELAANLPARSMTVIMLDQESDAIASQSKANPVLRTISGNVAYVIYTSGSTGKPKGTMVTHGNVTRLFAATQTWYQFDDRDVWTLFHSYAFDFSVWELWGALLYGGKLVVIPFMASRSPEAFYDLLRSERVTVLNQTPSAFRQLMKVDQETAVGAAELDLRLVIFGGEALAVRSLNEWYQRHSESRPQLVNMYGITETTVHVTYRPIWQKDTEAGSSSPLGQAIPDLELYILDAALNPVPIGVPGELHVGGSGLSRGYLHRPDLTAERFIPHPYSQKSGSRLYRTGDLARYLANGEIEYLGRIDQQVKIRGFRIELGEIEAVMRSHPAIREAEVMAREDELGEKHLVGYLVPTMEMTLTIDDLRHYLKEQLPEYMVPSAFVALEQMPLTAQGKVDRKALPAPDSARPRLQEEYVAPRTWQEKELAEIWSQALNIDPIGIHDNFFALGGDSILSIRILARAKEQGIHFSLQNLFQYPTIYELTQHLQTEADATEASPQPFGLISEQDRLRVPDGVEDAYPLIRMQAGMIFHSEYSPEDAVYHDIATYHLRAPLDQTALRATMQELLDRHAVLRTSFDLTNYSEPLQLVHKTVEFVAEVEDLRHLDAAEQEEALARLIATEQECAFDLTRVPLLRILVCRRSEDSFQLTISFHHAILDGWSLATLLTELLQQYWFLIGKHQQELAKAPQSAFRDFVALELKVLRSEDALRYWKEKLLDSPFTQLPRWPVAKQTEAAAGERISAIQGSVFVGLKQLGRLANAPLKSVLLAAHLRVLALLAGQPDVVTGVVSNGRAEEPDGERVLGLFLNTLPLRQELDGGTWQDLVKQTFASEREMLAHRRYPLAELQRIRGGSQLFEIAFNYVHFHVYQGLVELKDIGFLGGRFVEKTNFPLWVQFSLDVQASKIALTLKYDTEQFGKQQIEKIAGYYERVLESMASDPAARYECALLLSETETDELLVEWNQTAADYPEQRTIHQLFEYQAQQAPERIAVVYQGDQLTYGELDVRANQLASYLRGLGVETESLVGICLKPSLEMMVGLLGILKAGGAYVPLDPSYPQQRLRLMLENAQVPVLLTQQELVEILPQEEGKIVCLDLDADAIASQRMDQPPARVSEDNLAYVIYTSGSTGVPKGVQIQHHSVVNLLASTEEQLGVTAEDVLLSVTTLSFDIAALELFLPLLAGARVVLVSREDATDGMLLRHRLDEAGVTMMQATPATWRLLIDAGWDGATSLKVLCGGEALSSDLASALLERSTQVWNLYGPTETTIWSAVHPVEVFPNTIPIGRPLANTQIYLLDQRLHPVPAGVPGEIYIGGDGLARAYLNRPDITAERFIPNPFGGNGGGTRLYRTGDLGRYLPSGVIEYLGRIDQQVKLRGFRIELGEIEAVLSAHSAVREAVVVAREDTPGQKRLVAYIVQHPPGQIALPAESNHESQAEQLTQWRMVWNETYSQPSTEPDYRLNLIGWNSSYTGLPIPAEEMREWVDQTVARILSLSPKRVLEIGCGTGLLLFRLAPQVEHYRGTDISPRALEYVNQHVNELEQPAARIELSERAADNFEGMGSESPDVVILNSVVQYFPGLDYLLSVVTNAVEMMDQGFIFIGDVRNLRLLETFHASVGLHNAPPSMSPADWRQRIQERVAQEEELFIDPAFFYALRRELPKISRVQIQLKRGSQHNELTRFRYDVILHVGQSRPDQTTPLQLDWQQDNLSVSSLRHFLEENRPAALRVTGVPNLRLQRELIAARFLEDHEGLSTVSEIKERLDQSLSGTAVDPEELWTIGSQLPYTTEVGWSVDGVGSVDVLFTSNDVVADESQSAPELSLSSGRFANDPLRGMFARRLVPLLRDYVKTQLPDYMTPSAFVLLEKLPLTPNGKINRRALPAPDAARRASSAYVAPRTPAEELVANIWMRVLGVEQLSVEDNFFELGGHSLIATQVVTRIRETFKIELPLRVLFDQPTVAGLTREIERAVKAGQQLLAMPIRPVSREVPLRLSLAQQRLWFLDQLTPNNPFYNMQLGLRLVGELNVEALAEAVNEIVRRHEVFRTSFQSVEGEPVLFFVPAAPLIIQQVDLSGLGANAAEEISLLTRAEAQRPFDLAQPPLLRVALAGLGPQEHALILTMHHIISDGWSLSVLVAELAALYHSYCNQQPSPLPELPIQFADFAHWQREWLQGEVLERQLNYWKHQLTGIPPMLDMPTDRPRPAVQRYHGARLNFSVNNDVFEGLKALSRREGVTLYMTLLAVWQTLLSRYTGEEDICVGTPMANRNQTECEGLIGFFVDTLLLRGNLSGDPSFRTLLARVRETALSAYSHQDIPFEKLVDELHPERDMSRNPLFQVMFTVVKAAKSNIDLPGLKFDPMKVETVSTRFDLECQFFESAQELKGAITYSTELFDASTIHRLIEHMQVLLGGVVADPEQPISMLPLLSTGEEKRMLIDWNNTATDYPNEKCVHQAFAEQVARTPHNVAVVFDEERLSYAQLNLRANQLAHQLRAVGVSPEVRVGICIERSINMLVSVLAVLKAGGAYVPIDPQHPEERLSFTLADAQVAVILTEQKWVAQLPQSQAQILVIDVEVFVERDELEPISGVCSDNLAYVIYTSGSTGTPKGAMISHRGLMNYLTWATQAYTVADGNGVPVHSPLGFDLTVTSLLAPLLAGQSLVLLEEGVENLKAALVANTDFSLVKLTPAHLEALNHLIDESDAAACARTFVLGGEALLGTSVAEWNERVPGARIINEYGPTETVVGCCVYEVSEATNMEGQIPIGRPIANTELYILDKGMRPVPIGARGELYISGVGLARGYLNRPEVTAEKFLPHLFSATPGARLYRTGDLARYRPDGQIEFLGRADRQIKLYGYRIEPGEIEIVLGNHEAVREAVVIVREDQETDKRLTAYVVADEAAIEQTAWGQTLKRQQIENWKKLYEETYTQSLSAAPNGLNLAGWTSSYTGEAIPAEQMLEWRATTIGRVKRLKPQRILEIGCGTGLLLSELAPECEAYWGTDFSQASLAYLRQELERRSELHNVNLLCREADDLSGVPEGYFDTVILNSVVQYFPGADYLMRVLEAALSRLAPGGRIFIGDVRDLGLFEAFHLSVELWRADAETETDTLRQRIRRAMREEEELLVDPKLFLTLKQKAPRVSDVAIHLKRGVHENEMTRFRYDVVVHTETISEQPEWLEIDWQQEPLLVSDVERMLQVDQPERIWIKGVVNSRLAGEIKAVELLQGVKESPVKAGGWQQVIAVEANKGITPEQWWQLENESGYQVEVRWSDSADRSLYDVWCWRDKSAHPTFNGNGSPTALSLSKLANNPLRATIQQELSALLRSFLVEKLPSYMVPSAVFMCDEIPLTPNGKVDITALAKPEEMLRSGAIVPRDEVELQLARIWSEILSLDAIGMNDNFFDLGGNSMSAVRLMARIQKEFGQELPLSTLFQQGTVEHLAAILRQPSVSGTWSHVVEIQKGTFQPPLFFVHAAGGNVFSYVRLANRLGPDQPFYGVQASGLVGGQQVYDSVEEMAARYIEAIRQVQPRGPYFIGGWSFGGIVAFEVARQLVRQGQVVGKLILVDSSASIDGSDIPLDDEPALMLMFARDLGIDLDDQVSSYDDLQQLTAEEQLLWVLDQAITTHVLPPDCEFFQIQQYYLVYKSNLLAWSKYRPEVYSGRLTLFRASDRPLENYLDPMMGWNELASAGVELHTIAGGHYSLLTLPNVGTLAEELKKSLTQIQAAEAEG